VQDQELPSQACSPLHQQWPALWDAIPYEYQNVVIDGEFHLKRVKDKHMV
jgi:hypothetical protein